MSTDPSAPENDANLSGLGRALLETGGSKPASGPWVPPTAEELGKLLPDYEIVKMLGRGGMGAVYMGRQKSLDRPVAIKILSTALEDADPSFAERFKNEARAMGKLNHPGIVAVHDFGEAAGGLLYIVMEFVEGTDVAKMIAKEGRLHTEHAMAITAHVCDALAYAHERGIIHRDIKPANIMVGYDGVVKVADFGLAKMTHSNATGLTQSGMAMGTLHYMAPEALMLGSAVDHRADIYAVGVMLYQMLTGKIPQGMFKLPSLQIPGLDPRYDAIIAKAIMEDREARYQSVRELRRDLDGILTQPVMKVEAEAAQAPAALPTEARPPRRAGQPYRPPQRQGAAPRPKPSSSDTFIWAGMAALLLAIGAWWLLSKPAANRQQVFVQDMSAPSEPAPTVLKDGYTNSLGMKFVPVPGTSVLFGIHEVRYQDYAAYAAESPGVDDAWKDQNADGYTPTDKKEKHPVTNVSWEDAQKFCAWLSKKEGKTYRLPTDEEWSIAVGIGGDEKWQEDTTPAIVFKNQTDFPWGTQWPPPKGSGNYSDESRKAKAPNATAQYLENYDDGFPTTAPVMSFQPNKFGLYDLEGNVKEWVEDWMDSAKKARVFRGGSWFYGDRRGLLSSLRTGSLPKDRFNRGGFRCVLVASATGTASASAIPASSNAIRPAPPTSSPTPKDGCTNTLGMKFVPVPGTSVLFGIHEVRYQDYAAYAAETPGVDDAWKDQSTNGFTPTDRNEQHPVTKVSWEDAQAFCAWLSKKEGKNYRLPTDEEWSIAVGLDPEQRHPGTTPEMLSRIQKTKFPWGGNFPPQSADKVGNYLKQNTQPSNGQFLENFEDGYPTTAPVMSFKANSFGLYDMGGNVWEWCEDWFNSEQKQRVMRGGSWDCCDRNLMLSSFRNHQPPSRRYPTYGFRCVLVASTALTSAPAGPSAMPPSNSTASQATKDRPFVNTLGMKFVPVPGTEVMFCIHETRYKDYAAYAAETAGVDVTWRNQGDGGILPAERPEDHPVMRVSWEDAQKFCAWLSQKEGKRYRLPTDAEWSSAVGLASEANRHPGTTPARLHCKDQTSFPWGGDYPPRTEDQAGNYSDQSRRRHAPREGASYVDGYEDGFPNTAPVMSFRPNSFGLYDMGGNVWEWCEDWWDQAPRDRVLRGGAWVIGDRTSLLSSVRKHHAPNDRNRYYGGFRVVLELP